MKPRQIFAALLLTFLFIVFGSLGGLALASCTPLQRSIVRTVIDTVENVCGDAMTTEECLRRTDLALAPTAAPSVEPGGAPPGLLGAPSSTARPVAP